MTNLPIIQSVAVKAIIVHHARALVLQQSADPRYSNANRFHPPGGMVEPGEHLADALIREIREETQLAVEIVRLLDVAEWSATLEGQPHQFFGLFYLCRLTDGHTNPTFDRENTGYRWVSAADLADTDILEPSKSLIAAALRDHPTAII